MTIKAVFVCDGCGRRLQPESLSGTKINKRRRELRARGWTCCSVDGDYCRACTLRRAVCGTKRCSGNPLLNH